MDLLELGGKSEEYFRKGLRELHSPVDTTTESDASSNMCDTKSHGHVKNILSLEISDNIRILNLFYSTMKCQYSICSQSNSNFKQR